MTFDSRELELYRIAVEMADRVSARRATANTFYLTLQTSLVAVSAALDAGADLLRWAGILAALTWWLLLRSYRDLNSAKFKVILEIEKRLPVALYGDEWKYLKEDPVKSWRDRYAELGTVERLVPFLFIAIYAAGLSGID